MIIRKIKASDFEAWFKLEQEYAKHNNSLQVCNALKYRLNKKEMKKTFLRRARKKDSLFLVLEDENGMHGFFHGYIEKASSNGYHFGEDWIGYICNAFIEDRFRGKGYYSMLNKEFFKYLKKHKVKHCALHVDFENTQAINAYKRWGFKPFEYKMIAKLE